MKRFMFALGLLATVAVSESDAGYLVIRIVLEGGTAAPEGAGPYKGGPMMPGPLGTPQSGTGAAGKPPAGGPGPAPGSPGPGFGSGGGPPKGSGSGSGPPPLSGFGGPMGPGIPGGGLATGGNTIHNPTRSIYVVVPYTNDIHKHTPFYKKAPPGSFNPSWQPAIKHPFGYANLIDDNTQTQLYLDLGPQSSKGLKTKQSELVEKHAKWLRAPAVDAQILLDLLTEALEQGSVSEAMKYAEEIVATVQDKEKKARTTPQVDHFVAAYSQIKEGITRPARQASKGPEWKERLGFAHAGVREYISAHYHLLYWEGMDPEAMRRSAQLEDNFKAFYLVNAVRGIVLPVPESPLVAILAKTGGDVRKLSASLDGSPIVADGFYSPDHGIVVLSPERLDAVSQSFSRQIQDMFRQGVTRKDLLEGMGPKVDPNGLAKDSKLPDDVARMMTWVVAERYAEEEGEWSAVSREGTRQLLHAAGIMPQHVSLPLWLAEGSASYYERPKGPVFSTRDDKQFITVATTTGYGVPNFVRQKQFSELVRHKRLNADPGRTLRNVVTDAYFAATASGLDIDDPTLLPPHTICMHAGMKMSMAMPGGEAGRSAPPAPEDPTVVKRRRYEFVTNKAYGTSWSLYYYLAKSDRERPGLDRYLTELSKMPRDLPLDENTRLTAFARAFNLTLDAKRTDDRRTFAELGSAWLQFMDNVPPAGIELQLTDLAVPAGAGAGPGSGPPPLSGGPGPGGGPPKPGM